MKKHTWYGNTTDYIHWTLVTFCTNYFCIASDYQDIHYQYQLQDYYLTCILMPMILFNLVAVSKYLWLMHFLTTIWYLSYLWKILSSLSILQGNLGITHEPKKWTIPLYQRSTINLLLGFYSYSNICVLCQHHHSNSSPDMVDIILAPRLH